MDDVVETIGMARDLAGEIVGIAGDLLSAGVDVEHVQSGTWSAQSSFSLTPRPRPCSPSTTIGAPFRRLHGSPRHSPTSAMKRAQNSTNQDDDDCT